MKSFEVLREAIDEMGVKRVASDLKVSTSLVYKWCAAPRAAAGHTASGARNPLDRLVQLCRVTGDRRPVEWLCQQMDGYFVDRPDTDPDELEVEYLKRTQELLAEFSALLQVISDSIARESRIDEREAVEIRRQWHRLQSQGESFVRACEAGSFDPSR